MSKVVVLTGAGGVLCSELAFAFSKNNFKVAVLDLNEKAAHKIVNTINSKGGNAIAISANVLDKESLENAKHIINKEFGLCDILINGAGGNHPLGTTSNTHFTIEDLNNDINENNIRIKQAIDVKKDEKKSSSKFFSYLVVFIISFV